MSANWPLEEAPHAAAAPAADGVDAPAPAAPVLALVEATERSGHVAARLVVRRWPVTVGRALDADLVLDDPHVAARHLRLEPGAAGKVRVQVLQTRNGVQQGGTQHAQDSHFDWRPGELLGLGRLQLRLRLAETPVAEEQLLPRAPWSATGLSVLAVVAALATMFAQLWMGGAGLDGSWQEVPMLLLGGLGSLLLWAGLWALASRIISHHAQFWRHVRIAAAAMVLAYVLETLLQVLAFAFSWEMLGRFAYLGLVGSAAWGLYRHLVVTAPQSRRGILVGVLVALLAGVPATLGSQWLKNRRLTNQLYLAQFYPPQWRLAPTEDPARFVEEARQLRQRLELRLQDDTGEAADAEEEDEEE